MNRRSFLIALVGTPALAALASCGKQSTADPGADTGYTLPTGPDEVFLRIAYEGGFVAPETIFVRIPNLLIAGDGHAFNPAAITMEWPGPLIMPMTVSTITPEGLQRLAKLADDARLVGFTPDYTLPDGIGIADAPDTVVTLTVNGATIEHRAYALGLDEPSTPERNRLRAFVDSTANLITLLGAQHVGEASGYEPTAYRFRATVVDPAQLSEPVVTVDWSASTGVALADASECATVEAAKVATLLDGAKQNWVFRENELLYQLAITMVLPGDDACAATT